MQLFMSEINSQPYEGRGARLLVERFSCEFEVSASHRLADAEFGDYSGTQLDEQEPLSLTPPVAVQETP